MAYRSARGICALTHWGYRFVILWHDDNHARNMLKVLTSPQIQILYYSTIAELVSTRQVVTHTVTLTARTHTARPRGERASYYTRIEVASCEALRVGRVLRREHLALDPVEGPDGRQVDLAQADS